LRLRLQPGQQRVRQVDRRFQVGGEDPLDRRPILILEQAESADTGIVDEDIDAELARGTRQGDDSRRPLEIGADDCDASSQRRREGGLAALIAPGEQQCGAGVVQLASQFLAKATGRRSAECGHSSSP
jgi:hypothetical protein